MFLTVERGNQMAVMQIEYYSGALQGAENIIKKNKPKLAISVYKNKRDILDILVYIHNLVLEYNLYLRHYSDFEYDTVLYACV